ncbi:MAG: hypothetical protein N3F04_01900 [Candidatus Nezhaarchaeota archaeon]|nr:hypothetical protein [Candidatus Nezhaarchaeota archaeon]MCX8141531.1 hypothetical protein [Candidatus Nezhaarchaeota archaeon]MDW8049798.1 hypothetical protein [Nitrososphaerota archaeon]
MLRDRDAPVTIEGIILRVYGYDHPPGCYICDVEYAPELIYRSQVPKAQRNGKVRYYKFYEDEGLKFVLTKYPQYTIYSPILNTRIVAIREDQAMEIRRPHNGLLRLLNRGDAMSKASLELLDLILSCSKLNLSSFGVFGSLLHDFYRIDLSDLDLTIYGMSELKELRETLKDLYGSCSLLNEFDVIKESNISRWRFRGYAVKEYIWHQRRKEVYGILQSVNLGRKVKFEFEPVLEWSEISNEYEHLLEVHNLGFVEAIVRITDDRYAPYMPSKYGIEVLDLLKAPVKAEPIRIVSYVEEFRMQLFKDEVGFVAGWLEEVQTSKGSFQQIVLTRRERYYDQVLKLKDI